MFRLPSFAFRFLRPAPGDWNRDDNHAVVAIWSASSASTLGKNPSEPALKHWLHPAAAEFMRIQTMCSHRTFLIKELGLYLEAIDLHIISRVHRG